jgi:hypothetical protein
MRVFIVVSSGAQQKRFYFLPPTHTLILRVGRMVKSQSQNDVHLPVFCFEVAYVFTWSLSVMLCVLLKNLRKSCAVRIQPKLGLPPRAADVVM